jgi:hypothetical protein
MKRSFIMVFAFTCLIAIALAAQAQEPKVHSMTGCLKAGTAPGTYELTDVTMPAKGPKTVGIVSSVPNLAAHVGHKVEITGTPMPPDEAMKENKDVPKAPHYMTVTAMKHISATCP